MKTLFTSLWLMALAASAAAQEIDCSQYIKVNYDEVRGTRDTVAIDLLEIKEPLRKTYISLGKGSDSKLILCFYVSEKGLTCIDNRAEVFLLFRNEIRDNFLSQSTVNCKGQVYCKFGGGYGNNKILYEMKDNLLKTVRIYGTDSYYDIPIDDKNAEMIQGIVRCLVP